MDVMQKLNLPEYTFSYRLFRGKRQIFDSVRKKFVSLSPEEWVRQNFIAWLIQTKKYPAGLIAVEKELSFNDMKKRYDAVIYSNKHAPAMLIECKAPGISITQKVFDQAARYNLVLKVKHLIITNGMNHYYCSIDFENGSFAFNDKVPDYDELF
jgi:hypothetical protein